MKTVAGLFGTRRWTFPNIENSTNLLHLALAHRIDFTAEEFFGVDSAGK
jgi:hypothetical protein